MKTSDRNTQVRFSEAKFILKQTRKLADERLVFMDGKRLGDVSIGIEDNVSNQFKNLFGQVPTGFHYCA